MRIRQQCLIVLLSCFLFFSCKGQVEKAGAAKSSINNQIVGGAFENSSSTYLGMPTEIKAIDTSPGWNQQGQRLLLTGIVYQQDGKTPARDVLLYYYQTNVEGRYLHRPDQPRSMPPNEKGQTHGYIRGWVKTGSDGKYFIYTVRPGSYPDFDEPAHIHLTIKEPNDVSEYYVDDFVFDDDKLLTSAKRKKMENRGGSGTLRLVQKDDLHVGERNIILGLNIPNYPKSTTDEVNSGNSIGEDVFSFIPYHAWGPDKGTKTCPVCKYGWYHGVLYFVGNTANWNEIKAWLSFLEAESRRREKYLKVYFVYGKEQNFSKGKREAELEKLGQDLQLEKVALTFVPSFADTESEINLNNINQDVKNTFILYRRSRIIDKFIDLKPTKENFRLLTQRLDDTINEYYDLSKPQQLP